MSNPIVEMMQDRVGKKLDDSPSPVSRWLKGTLLSAEEGKLRIEFKVRKEMTNPVGILHGGSAAMIMDDVIGATVYTLNREHFFTSTNISIDFLNPAKKGQRIIAVAEVMRAGRTIINAECRLFNEEGQMIAKGMSNLVRTRQEIPK